MVKTNLGKLDRIFRFVLAVWWLGPFAPNLGILWANWAVFVVGWIALVESFLGYCALHEMFKINNKGQ